MVVALAAIGFAVYQHHHHGLRVNTGGELPSPVLVAKRTIPKGTSGFDIAELRLYTVKTVRPGEIPDKGALVSPSAIAGKVTVRKIPAGAELTISEFGPPSP